MKRDDIKIKQLPGSEETICPWHGDHQKTGKVFSANEIFTSDICPIMFHTLYPYFLGAEFGATYGFNEDGDCQVCCPAEKGVDVLVKVRPNDGKFEDRVPDDWRDVIHAEVVAVHGECDYNHKVGDRLVFPTCMKKSFACPAGVYNLFPFLEIDTPKCINKEKLRCPDWVEDISFSLSVDED